MENTFLVKASKFISAAFDKISVSWSRQALSMLDDRTLNDIGFTRQQVINRELSIDGDTIHSFLSSLR
jgi:hypothetical protein